MFTIEIQHACAGEIFNTFLDDLIRTRYSSQVECEVPPDPMRN